MKNFKDWSIRFKLIVPLFLVVVLGGGGIISTFVGLNNEITKDSLPEERALNGIRRASLELLSEYREFMILPNDTTFREIGDLKEEIEAFQAAYEVLAEHERAESIFIPKIRAAAQRLQQRGDEAIEQRRRQLEIFTKIETFEELTHDLPTDTPDNADDTGGGEEASAIHELIHDYLSELREFALLANDSTREEIAEIELSINRISQGIDPDRSSGSGQQELNAGERVQVQQLLEAGRLSTALTVDFLAKTEVLENSEDELLQVLGKASAVVAHETNVAFETGFTFIGIVILIVLMLIFVIGYVVSQSIAKPVTTLMRVANQLGGGDLTARVGVVSQDEIGSLAIAFNQMAGSLETNVERREHAENDLKALNEGLEQRVNERTSELRAAQDELLRKERLAVLGQLTATVSHELRNPLGTIQTSLFTVSERTRDKGLGIERAIERMERNIGRCDVIIGDLLDFTRLRDLDRKTINIDDWVTQTLDEYAVPEGIALDRALDCGISLAIDGERLRRTLINVLDNACDAVAEGDSTEGTVTVSSRVNEGRLEISITDNGPGFPAEVLPKVFEPLYSTKSFGVGLGLPLVQQIMEQHGGGIEIGNQESGGAHVLLWLPVDQCAKGSEA